MPLISHLLREPKTTIQRTKILSYSSTSRIPTLEATPPVPMAKFTAASPAGGREKKKHVQQNNNHLVCIYKYIYIYTVIIHHNKLGSRKKNKQTHLREPRSLGPWDQQKHHSPNESSSKRVETSIGWINSLAQPSCGTVDGSEIRLYNQLRDR